MKRVENVNNKAASLNIRERKRRSRPEPAVASLRAAAGLRADSLPDLVLRAQDGDIAALDTLILRFQNMAVGYAASLLGEMSGAEDVAQEAFVEALHRLPDLQHPAAFPSLLQSLLRKHCDRLTRRRQFWAVTLDDACGATASRGDPAKELAVSEMREVIRHAVRDLPEPERAVVLLFYVGEQSLKEISKTLGVPASTVKGRLHAARTRLKRRMLVMSEESLKEERPSTNAEFREKVKREHLHPRPSRFHTPMPGCGPQPPNDWYAMERDLVAFEEKLLAGEPLDRKAVKRLINKLVWDFDKFSTAVDLLNIYLARPNLTPPERAEATCIRLSALIFSGSRGEYLRLHKEFLDWIRPYVGTRTMAEIVPDEGLMLWAFTCGSPSSTSMLWWNLGHFEEWLTRGRQILAEMPPNAVTRRDRYQFFRLMAMLLRQDERDEEAWRTVRASERLSDEADRDWQSPSWRIDVKTLWDSRYEDRTDSFVERDTVSRLAVAEEIERLVAEYLPTLDLNDEEQSATYFSCVEHCAGALHRAGQYQRAWAYYQRLIASGHYGHVTLVQAAAALWKVQGESARAEIVSLLQMSSVRPDSRPGWTLEVFRKAPEFADVYDDPDFVAAMGTAD